MSEELNILSYALSRKYTDLHGGDSGGETVYNQAKRYTDAQVAASETEVKNYADQSADTKSASALSSAKTYADSKDTNTLNSAKSYANSQDVATLNSAKNYTNSEIVTAKAQSLAEASAYADDADEVVLEEAKKYVDESSMNSYIVSEGTMGKVSLGTEWSATEPHTIVATPVGYTVTEKTMVSIPPHAGTLIQMRNDGVQTLYITNDNGVLTAYAIGNAPSVAMEIPALFTEVT